MASRRNRIVATLFETLVLFVVLLGLGYVAWTLGRQWYPEMTYWQGYATVTLVALITVTHNITNDFTRN